MHFLQGHFRLDCFLCPVSFSFLPARTNIRIALAAGRLSLAAGRSHGPYADIGKAHNADAWIMPLCLNEAERTVDLYGATRHKTGRFR
jgi:hypothetical protein